MADTRLIDVANSLLTVISTEMESAGITMPERQYVHSGTLAHDLEAEDCSSAFVVTFSLLSQGQVGPGLAQPNSSIKCAMPTVAEFDIVLLRCVPILTEDRVPSAAELQASAIEILTDAMTLTKVVIDESLRNSLTGIGCSLNAINSVTPVGPLGGVGGTDISITVGLV